MEPEVHNLVTSISPLDGEALYKIYLHARIYTAVKFGRRPNPNWRIAPCLLSTTVYSIDQLPPPDDAWNGGDRGRI